jgi:PAS domain S-box-containing protein
MLIVDRRVGRRMVSHRDGVTVLHVDDEPDFSALVEAYLQREADDVDLRVESVERAQAALERIEAEPSTVDCVVSDYEMPEMDGLDFLRALRSTRPNLPFILYTGKGSEEVARDAFRVGATDYVQKRAGTDQYAVLANRVLNAVSRERARAATARYDTAFEALDTAVYVLDEDGRFTTVDEVFVDLVGYGRPDVVGTHVSALCPDDEGEGGGPFLEHLDAILSPEGPETVRFEADVCTADRSRVHCVATMAGRPLEDGSDGRGRRVVGTVRDVTEKRRHRETIHYRGKLKDVVLDTSTTLMSAEPDEIGTKVHWTLQSLGEFVEADRCVVYRYDPDADVLRKTNEWTAPEASPQTTAISGEDCSWLVDSLCRFENVCVRDREMLPPEAANVTETLDVPSDGSFVVVPMVSNWSLAGAVTFVAGGKRSWPDKEVSLLRTAADMLSHTLERQRRVRELRRQNERLDEFASVVSHDLRNPLNVADGFVDLARDTGDVDHLDRAASALDRMDTLVGDVLELARQGRTVGETSQVELGGLVERAWRAVETGEATLVVDEETATVSADAARLCQAVENLFRNSVEHGTTSSQTRSDDSVEHGSTSSRAAPDDAVEHGREDVTIRVGALEDGAGFYVEDDGPGIPAEERERIFDHGHTTAADGSGFGLSIVESIVEAHGWTIRPTDADTGGARFEILTTLPTDFDARTSE